MNIIKIKNQSEIKNHCIPILNSKTIYVESISETMAMQSVNPNHPYFQREITSRVLGYYISKKQVLPKKYNVYIDVLSASKTGYNDNGWDVSLNIYIEA